MTADPPREVTDLDEAGPAGVYAAARRELRPSPRRAAALLCTFHTMTTADPTTTATAGPAIATGPAALAGAPDATATAGAADTTAIAGAATRARAANTAGVGGRAPGPDLPAVAEALMASYPPRQRPAFWAATVREILHTAPTPSAVELAELFNAGLVVLFEQHEGAPLVHDALFELRAAIDPRGIIPVEPADPRPHG
ncbi:hypothetical protein Dvina_21475 [Dactylosporangium vinaceum]|uniref:Uncharacterized protein n=1 Tax=Dactylosporangium vinaceum TaxID=53362 RepID=A0ABV5MRM8_9ACTN|nr:hypothetical protein [Dactylosporangium vinaceum]UAC00395.1 hypothetical protein Dvina_21475 [Dactylosporangium vinaceum]